MSSFPGPARDLTRTTLAVLFITALIGASFWILRPFLAASVWATMIVVATWPLMLRVQRWLGNRRALAVSVMTAVLLLVYVVPFMLAVGTVLDQADRIAGWADTLATVQLPRPPEAVHRIPFVGARIAAAWERAAAASVDEVVASL